MHPNQGQLSPFFNPWYWSPSYMAHRRARDSARRVSDSISSVEPCYFYESHDRVAYLDVELPGVRKEHINVEVNGSHLCISGKRFRIDHTSGEDNMNDKQEPDEPNIQEEQLSFVYFLQIRLGQDADAENISAGGFSHGILMLTIPIKSSQETRKISIQL